MFIDESVTRRLLRMVPSLRTDPAIYYLLAPRMLGFWTYLRPKHAGEEVSDVLFTYGDVCVQFEAKTRDAQTKASDAWLRGKLKEAVAQLRDNQRRLSSGEVPTLRNRWRGETAWSTLGVKYYQGIVVMMAPSDPYDPLVLAPDLVDDVPFPVHFISLPDLEQILKVFNTPWDFVVYWEFRHLLAHNSSLRVHEEQTVFWTIIKNWPELARAQGTRLTNEQLQEDREFLLSYARVVMMNEGADDNIRKRVAASYLVDIAAGSLVHEAHLNEDGTWVSNPEHETLVRTVEILVEITRHRRTIYGTMWVDLAQRAISQGEDAWGHGHSRVRDTSYLFCARSGATVDSPELQDRATQRMSADGSSRVVALTATASSIIDTYQDLLATLRSDSDRKDSEDVLNTTSLLMEKEQTGSA